MAISIVCITCNHLPFTKLCLESVFRYTDLTKNELIVVDNGSTDGTQDYLKTLGIRYHLFSENMGCAIAKNKGIRMAEPSNDILILDNDNIVATPNWLEILDAINSDIVYPYVFVSHLTYCQDEIINSDFYSNYMNRRNRLLQSDNLSNASQVVDETYPGGLEAFARSFVARNKEKQIKTVLWPGCFLIRRRVLDKIGIYDEGFGKCAFYDVDLANRACSAGFKSHLTLSVFLHHFGSITTRKSGLSGDTDMKAEEKKSSLYFQEKWSACPHPTYQDLINVNAISPGISGIPGFMSEREVSRLFSLSREKDGLHIEIGALMGRSSCHIAAGLGQDDLLVSIDPFDTFAHAAGPTRDLLFQVMGADLRPSYFHLWHFHMNTYCPTKNFMFLIGRGEEKFLTIRAMHSPVSFLFIDTDHSEEGMRAILETYSPLLAPDAVIAVHDYGDPKWGQNRVIDEYIASGKLSKIDLVDSLIVLK